MHARTHSILYIMLVAGCVCVLITEQFAAIAHRRQTHIHTQDTNHASLGVFFSIVSLSQYLSPLFLVIVPGSVCFPLV